MLLATSTSASSAAVRIGRLVVIGILALLLFAIFVVFLEFGFFVAKQFLNHLAARRISYDFEHCSIVFNILPYDKNLSSKSAPRSQPSYGWPFS